MGTFSGILNANEIFASIYNMIIGQHIFADNIAGTYGSLVDAARIEGGLYGDTKLFYATDALPTYAWTGDSEAANLLSVDRPADPECQAITIDTFRQIRITLDNYLTKRAWMQEGAFDQFTSVLEQWLGDTKKIYDSTLYNTFIGTNETATGSQTASVTLPVQESHYYDGTDADSTDVDLEATNRLEAVTIGETIANILVDLKDATRDYNDYGYMRSYNLDDIVIVWNAYWLNKIRKVDLPTIFHENGILEENIKEEVLPARYFGSINASGGTAGAANITIYAAVEKDYTVSSTTYHVYPGQLLPGSAAYLANETYTRDDTIACKIMHKNSVPYMSGFSVNTSFFNPRALNENRYLTFGHNSLEHLKNYPFITIKAVQPS